MLHGIIIVWSNTQMDPKQKSSKISRFIQMQGAFPKNCDNPTQEKEDSFFKMFLAR